MLLLEQPKSIAYTRFRDFCCDAACVCLLLKHDGIFSRSVGKGGRNYRAWAPTRPWHWLLRKKAFILNHAQRAAGIGSCGSNTTKEAEASSGLAGLGLEGGSSMGSVSEWWVDGCSWTMKQRQ